MKRILELVKTVGFKISAGLALAGSYAAVARAQAIGGQPVEPISVYPGTLENLITTIVEVVLLVAGILAVVYLIYGGLMYITAGGEAEKATKGRTAITNAIIGIIIIAASLAIYKFVVQRIQ